MLGAAQLDIEAIEQETVKICAELIRYDTSNFGDGSGPCERLCAEYVMGLLTEVGYDPQYFESEPRRGSIVLRIPGTDPSLPALIVHGHTDVVPAVASDWSVDPFAAEIREGYMWGRGAVDMKNMDAMILAVVRDMARRGWRTKRDLIIAIMADEEAGGWKGAHWLVDNHPGLFEGASEAISEVGGYSVNVDGRRVYLLQTAEKGLAWLRLTASGTAGHGSQVNPDNAVTRLAGAVHRIGTHAWPLHLTGTVCRLLEGVSDLTGLPFEPEDRGSIDRLVEALGFAGRFVGATVDQAGSNPSQLDAGYKVNVIPGQASAAIDVRYVPGTREQTLAKIDELAGPGITREFINDDVGLEVGFDTPFVEQMITALDAEDPGAVVLPYMLSAGTDNKSFSQLGVAGYGFAPLKLPADFDFPAMFHGVDERVPLESLKFGARVLYRLLRAS